MPGLFAFAGSDNYLGLELKHEFSTKFSDSSLVAHSDDFCSMGCHVTDGISLSIGIHDSMHFVVDGENHIYEYLKDKNREKINQLFSSSNGEITFTSECKGNIIVCDKRNDKLIAYKDWSSCFPLYYTIHKGNFLSASHLRPLAKITNAAQDDLGILEYVSRGYSIGKRTLFKGIFKLMPGQYLQYSVNNQQLTITETSKLWCYSEEKISFNKVVDEFSEYFNDFFCQQTPYLENNKLGLFFSAGWDSRLILSSILSSDTGSDIYAINFDNSRRSSRESKIVSDIAQKLNINCYTEKCDVTDFDLEFYKEMFHKCEVLSFPEWYYLSKKFKDIGVKLITGGNLGEVLGGHYEIAFFGNFLEKMFHFLKSHLNLSARKVTLEFAENFLVQAHKDIPWPWLIKKNFLSIGDVKEYNERMVLDVIAEIDRHKSKGIHDGGKLVEAFITEHRGFEHISGQRLATRSHADICLPFVDRTIISRATSIPLEYRVQNKLTKAIIERNCPELLKFPTAAILTNAGSPLIIQEGSRAIRKIIEESFWQSYIKSKGKIMPFPVIYNECEYLRDGHWFKDIVSSLTLDCLNKSKINSVIEDIIHFRNKVPCFVFKYQLSKLLYLDFIYRK